MQIGLYTRKMCVSMPFILEYIQGNATFAICFSIFTEFKMHFMFVSIQSGLRFKEPIHFKDPQTFIFFLLQLKAYRPKKLMKLPKKEKTVQRAYGGSRCFYCVRERQVSCFLCS